MKTIFLQRKVNDGRLGYGAYMLDGFTVIFKFFACADVIEEIFNATSPQIRVDISDKPIQGGTKVNKIYFGLVIEERSYEYYLQGFRMLKFGDNYVRITEYKK